MKRLIFGFFTLSFFALTSCSGEGSDTETTDNDSTQVSEEIIDEEESNELAFDGTDAGDYLLYGHTEFMGDNAVTVEEMMSTIETDGSFKGEVKVVINEVCQKAGCWITFDDNAGGAIRVFFRDHFTIPTETVAGTEAILLGESVNDTLDVAFQKHLLDDAKEAGEEVSDEEYAAITEDKIETTFDCEAILVKK